MLHHPHMHFRYREFPKAAARHDGLAYELWHKHGLRRGDLVWCVTIRRGDNHLANIWVGHDVEREVDPDAEGITLPYYHEGGWHEVKPGEKHIIRGEGEPIPNGELEVTIRFDRKKDLGPRLVIHRGSHESSSPFPMAHISKGANHDA